MAGTKFLRGAPPALAGDQFKSRADLADDEGLNNTVLPNRLDQFQQHVARKILPRLQRARDNARQFDLVDSLARI
jgi:hypothetical protein